MVATAGRQTSQLVSQTHRSTTPARSVRLCNLSRVSLIRKGDDYPRVA